jgi:hypothetical protein
LKKLILFFLLYIVYLIVPAQEIDQTKEKKSTSSETPLKDKVFVGGGLGLSFGTETYINLAPQIGLKLDEHWMLGTGVQYTYYSSKTFNYSTSSIGGSVFARFFPLQNIFGQAELEVLRGRWDVTRTGSFNATSAFIGGGYFQGEGRFGFFILGLYNLNYSVYSPYSSPLIFRMGINIGL